MNLIIENIKNAPRIWRMALIDVKEEFRGAKLGIFWEVVRTLIFFTVYGIFKALIKKKTDIDDIFMLYAALMPWQLITVCIAQVPKTYKQNKILVNSIKFPLQIIPTFDILGKMIIHMITTVIVTAAFLIKGYGWIGYFQLIYYYIALFLLLVAMLSILSLLCTISVDIYKMWKVIRRIFLYLNPIFWDLETIKDLAEQFNIGFIVPIVKLNPFVYILEGFRGVMMPEVSNYGKFIPFNTYTLYFWCLVLGLIFIGNFLQKKLLKILPDII